MATMVSSVPPCRSLGAQCKSLRGPLRIGELEEGTTSLDHEATWLLGHTQHITFGKLWVDEGELYVDAILHVACRFLNRQGAGGSCAIYGYRTDRLPAARHLDQPRTAAAGRRRHAEERLEHVQPEVG